MTTTTVPTCTSVHGYPRQGAGRELKKAIEAYWAGSSDPGLLADTVRRIRRDRLEELRRAGVDDIPSNDFSLYDHVLDAAVLLGAVPDRHRWAIPDVSTPRRALDRYFLMARGSTQVEPLEMTKWFDTNYHYLVPELGPRTDFALDATKPLTEFGEAAAAGTLTRPVVLGPITFLLLSKPVAGAPDDFDPLTLLDRIVPLYAELLQKLRAAGAEWVQLDEPALVTDQSDKVLTATAATYARLTAQLARPKILVATYFDRLGDALPVLRDSDVDGVALDFTGRAAANAEHLEAIGGLRGKRLVAGVIDGRNVWAADLAATVQLVERLRPLAGTVDVSTSCSLLHVPLDVSRETEMTQEMRGWLAFARQKLQELQIVTQGVDSGADAIAEHLANAARCRASRAASPLVRNPAVRERAAGVCDADLQRGSDYAGRRTVQEQRLRLPLLPTTTIGSFPQTAGLRQARALLRTGQLSTGAYADAMRSEIRDVIAEQERIGLDVLVHGEPERNDMVQFFAEQLDGFVATMHGWVQSYGTRYVRPPIIVGDVSRSTPMTVAWSTYAQSLTTKPVKGMLTGPVTMLAWSFVRDDQPLSDTARQVALALRDELADLEAAGVGVVQVDEPALRETLPLRRADRAEYLSWAVSSFRLATAGVEDGTQIHTHMCYAEFGDVLQAIIDMDADVISLEAARSGMAIVNGLRRSGYPNEVGPGVWDIHSPRVPSVEEVVDHIREATSALPAERLWVNPDCGLKTRAYPEVRASLTNLVAAADRVRTGATTHRD